MLWHCGPLIPSPHAPEQAATISLLTHNGNETIAAMKESCNVTVTVTRGMHAPARPLVITVGVDINVSRLIRGTYARKCLQVHSGK